MQNQNFKKLLYTSTILLFAGFIFLFINLPLGILLLFAFLACGITLNIKYPNELKEFQQHQKELREKKINNKTMPEFSSQDFKFFKVNHISGIEYAKRNEKCEITISTDDVSFYDKQDDFMSCFKFDELKNCIIYEEIEQKLKNTPPLIRTIAGGVLLAPVGTVVCGVSGTIPTIKENKKYYMEFEFKDSDIKENILISSEYKILKQIEQTIKIMV